MLGELVKARPFHGTKHHWRDVLNADLKSLNVLLNTWPDRKDWFQLYIRSISRTRDSQHPGVYNTFMGILVVDVAIWPITLLIIPNSVLVNLK